MIPANSEVEDLCKAYPPIDNYGIIGNMHTVALSGSNGSIDFMCYPIFDSPSIFARLLDHKKGGHFSISPSDGKSISIKQQYLPETNILSTRFLNTSYSLQLNDYMHLPNSKISGSGQIYPWLIRSVASTRGKVSFKMELYPSFNYAQDAHTTKLVKVENPVSSQNGRSGEHKVVFESEKLTMDLRYVFKCNNETPKCKQVPEMKWNISEVVEGGNLGPGVELEMTLEEGQEIVFFFREVPSTCKVTENCDYKLSLHDPELSVELSNQLFEDTYRFWQSWIRGCTYKGRWREAVHRSALTLKLLTYKPTGAIVASPTFSLPEFIGGTRNWDYRFSWIRDASFTIYAFIRLGFIEEAHDYMRYIENRLSNLNKDGSLSIMYSIHGSTELEEIELNHLDGYRGSKPVRIGNGAADHIQLDIYGELLDAIYLFNKFGVPISYDMWVKVRNIADYVVENWDKKDMSIWEVRNQQQNFLYSKILCWVALDRSIRLSEKRNLPCLQKDKWLKTRDTIYEEVMTKGWNDELKMFKQSFEADTSLDSSVLIMPLVFFISPSDPRLLSTIDRILLPLEKGGLVSNGLVYRYNHLTSEDGVGGEEGSFSMCTFWLIEALTRAGKYNPRYLHIATNMFEQMLGYSNHLCLYSEEIATSGEALGNFPQAFTHIALISAAFNLDRVLK